MTIVPDIKRVWDHDLGADIFVASHRNGSLSSDVLVDTCLDVRSKIEGDVIGICETRQREEHIARWHTGDQAFLGEAFESR